MPKINLNNLHKEKLTNEPFDEVIGHSENERIYFTIENNDIIYQRLRKETDLRELPYLGICVDYGQGDLCLEESIKDNQIIFKFYIIDRFNKFEYAEFSNIEEAINKIIEYYTKYEMVSEPEKVKEIFRETLNLTTNKELTLNKNLKK